MLSVEVITDLTKALTFIPKSLKLDDGLLEIIHFLKQFVIFSPLMICMCRCSVINWAVSQEIIKMIS